MYSEQLGFEAQSVLDELFENGLMPFRLTADEIDCVGLDEYIIRFQDNRLRSVDVSWQEGEPFKDRFRLAMVSRMSRMRALAR